LTTVQQLAAIQFRTGEFVRPAAYVRNTKID
jgi:hypothetical protein